MELLILELTSLARILSAISVDPLHVLPKPSDVARIQHGGRDCPAQRAQRPFSDYSPPLCEDDKYRTVSEF